MKKLWLMIALLIFFCSTLMLENFAQAHPSRVRSFVHGTKGFNGFLDLKADFIPSGNLLSTPLSPIGYLIADIKTFRWLTLQPAVGYLFNGDEAILSPRFGFNAHDFYIWALIEIRPQSMGSYWFAQAEYKLTGWLELGLEEESWGDFDEFSKFSHGGGPNILLKFGMLRVDLTVHGREMEENFGPEFFARFHLFLPKI